VSYLPPHRRDFCCTAPAQARLFRVQRRPCFRPTAARTACIMRSDRRRRCRAKESGQRNQAGLFSVATERRTQSRNRSGNPYRADTLSDDFADVRELTFPGDKRRLMDMRRSGVVQAIAGEAGPLGLSAKLANSKRRPDRVARCNRRERPLRCRCTRPLCRMPIPLAASGRSVHR